MFGAIDIALEKGVNWAIVPGNAVLSTALYVWLAPVGSPSHMSQPSSNGLFRRVWCQTTHGKRFGARARHLELHAGVCEVGMVVVAELELERRLVRQVRGHDGRAA